MLLLMRVRLVVVFVWEDRRGRGRMVVAVVLQSRKEAAVAGADQPAAKVPGRGGEEGEIVVTFAVGWRRRRRSGSPVPLLGPQGGGGGGWGRGRGRGRGRRRAVVGCGRRRRGLFSLPSSFSAFLILPLLALVPLLRPLLPQGLVGAADVVLNTDRSETDVGNGIAQFKLKCYAKWFFKICKSFALPFSFQFADISLVCSACSRSSSTRPPRSCRRLERRRT